MAEDKALTGTKAADMQRANKLAEEITLLVNECDMATALTAIGMVLGGAVLVFGTADAFFPALRAHAESVAAATYRAQAMRALDCAGTA